MRIINSLLQLFIIEISCELSCIEQSAAKVYCIGSVFHPGKK
jgi:hypothetical protein